MIPRLIRGVFAHGKTREDIRQVIFRIFSRAILINTVVLYFRYGSDSFDISEIIESVFGSAKTKQEKDEV